jgi:hypothetical protein
MRSSRFLTVGICSLLLLAGLSRPAPASADDGTVAPKQLRQLKLLQEVIDMKDFQVPMTLKEALGLLQDKLNAKYGEDALPILVDEEAFKGADPNATVFDTQVKFPPFPRRMTIAVALRVALSRIESAEATFLLRNGVIEVTTLHAASPQVLLRQKVFARFDRRPLAEVVEELSARTGVSILLDTQLGEKLKAPVTASLNNDVTLEATLRLLANMAGLRLTLTEGAPYITSPAEARRLEREHAARAPRVPAAPAKKTTPERPKSPDGR